jgi:hypothetical protein
MPQIALKPLLALAFAPIFTQKRLKIIILTSFRSFYPILQSVNKTLTFGCIPYWYCIISRHNVLNGNICGNICCKIGQNVVTCTQFFNNAVFLKRPIMVRLLIDD